MRGGFFRRVLVCFLTGNTDAHLKNFAMFHTADGLRLTPAYDLVAAALYREYQQLALAVAGAADLRLGGLLPKHLLSLGTAHGLDAAQIMEAITNLDRRRNPAEKAITEGAKRIGVPKLGTNLLDLMERRWNGTFKSTGPYLSKKR